MRVTLAFIRSAFHNTYIYRSDFWIRLLSGCIMMYATYSLWNILYQQNPGAFGMERVQMVTYGVLGVIMYPIMDSAMFVQYYMAEQVRQGTLEMDLVKPLNFIFHMFSRFLGFLCVQAALQSLPAFFVAALFLEFRLPATPELALAFFISLLLGYLIFFALSLMMGMLSIITLKIDSLDWAYDSLVRFSSGQFVPLWMFPPVVGAIVAFLPFKQVFFVPMSIYIGAADSPLSTLLLSQAAWAIVLFGLSQLLWLRVHRRITIQGG